MRVGVLDVLPESAVEGLTAEDLRLLLNGVGDINVAALVSYTSFNDESGEPPERLARFKRWLWAIVDKMTHLERQDLVSNLIFSDHVFYTHNIYFVTLLLPQKNIYNLLIF